MDTTATFARTPDLTLNGINAWMVGRHRKGNGWPDGPWREVDYLVAWPDSDDFIDALVPNVTFIGIAGVGGTFLYKWPHFYPHNLNLCCLQADAEGVGSPQPDPKLIAFDAAIVTARYVRPPFDVQGQDSNQTLPGAGRPFSSIHRKGYTETEQLPESAFEEEGGGGQHLAKKFPMRFAVVEYTIVYHYMPYFYNPPLELLLDKLNDAPFLGYPTGTVMYHNFDCEPDTSSGDGVQYQTITQTLLIKPWDWNTVMSVTEGAGRKRAVATSGGSTSYPYAYADLTPMLMPATGQ